MNAIAIRFENWQKVLQETVPVRLQRAYHEAITKFRYWLWEQRKTATVAAFKEHLAWKQSYLPPEKFAVRQAALRWYYQHGEKLPATPASEAGPAAGQTALPVGPSAGQGAVAARETPRGQLGARRKEEGAGNREAGGRELTMNDVPLWVV